jgi:uncharacterized RDD family membrane protein YckC
MSGEGGVELAPLLRRLGAVAVDYLIVSAYLVVLVVIGLTLRANAGLANALFGSPLTGELTGLVVLTAPVTLYFAFAEASPLGATVGKGWTGLRVVTIDGERLPIDRSLLRSVTKFVPWELAHAAIWQYTAPGPDQLLPTALLAASWILVGINVAMAVLDGRHRALHDRVAGSLVVRTPSR